MALILPSILTLLFSPPGSNSLRSGLKF